MRKTIKVGRKSIGENAPCFIVAEAGANHNGKLELAKKLAQSAAAHGADAVKFQTYVAEKLTTRTAPKYWVDSSPSKSQYELFKTLDKLSEEDWKELAKFCRRIGIIFFSTPFDFESADLLEELGVPLFKIASADITCLPFIKHVAEKGKPIMLSTGAATIEEIREAVKTIESTGNDQIIILHCTLSYPTPIKDANLRVITTLQKRFPTYPIGLSDHTLGITAPIAATVLGAKVIEKHFTINKNLPGSPDHKLSIDPKELENMVAQIRLVEKLLGSPIKQPVKSELKARKYARRSIVAKVRIPKGAIITEKMITFKRPGIGIPPKLANTIIGKRAKRTIKEDEIISFKDIEMG